MKQMILYKKAGAYSYSPINDGGEPSGLVRLIPDEGMALTNGVDTVSAIDVRSEDIPKWSEVIAPPEPIDTDPEAVIAEMEGLL
jgi:hypothetical protein